MALREEWAVLIADFFGGPPEINHGTVAPRTLYFLLKRTVMDIHQSHIVSEHAY